MPADEGKRTKSSEPHTLRVASGKMFTPIELAERIHNFARTEENTLKSAPGLIPYCPRIPERDGADTSPDAEALEVAEQTISSNYQEDAYDVKTFQVADSDGDAVPIHGIFHARLNRGQRDVLLVQRGDSILVHKGYTQSWRVLVGPSVLNELSVEASLETSAYDSPKVRFPTQFLATPTGIVIVPQGESDPCAYFYDGEVVLPLGYRETPGSPTILGPSTSGSDDWKTNQEAFSIRQYTRERDSTDYVHRFFGSGRIGTVQTMPDGNHKAPKQLELGVGHLEPGSWQGAIQWVDYWGNLSPVSPRSASVNLDYRASTWTTGSKKRPYPPSYLRHSFHWSDISVGRRGTVGRTLFRTRDIMNSGTRKLFAIPSTTMSSVGEIALAGFSTVTENISTDYPDNHPDMSLGAEPKNIIPIPKFRLCELAFGRMWIGNFHSDPGMIRHSMPGTWGTFEFGSDLIPDSKNQITGMKATQGGLLVFTESSSYLVRPNAENSAFTSATISSQVGCVAPDSIQTMPDGSVIWLGHNYFYRYDGEKIAPISEEIQHETRRINRARAPQACAAIERKKYEYMCWVAVDESDTNNLCFVFDGKGWKTRNGENFQTVCESMDHRGYILGAGVPNGEFLGYTTTSTLKTTGDLGASGFGTPAPKAVDFQVTLPATTTVYPDVWVLDHEWIDFEVDRDNPFIETSWINALQEGRSTPLTLKVWLRETSTQEKLQVDIYRDWRKNTVVDTVEIDLHSNTDKPATWASDEGDAALHTLLDATDEYISKRRPFWVRKDIFIPSCKTFKLIFRRTPRHPITTVPRISTTSIVDGFVTTETSDSGPFRRSPIEFIAFTVEEASRPSGMRMNRPKKG